MQDQSVIVTGGASGIGKATVLLLARKGARVFIGDVDQAGGQAAVAAAVAERLSVEYLPLDLTDPSSIAGFAAAVNQRTGRVDGLVNGAGWDQIQPFLENPPEMWDRVVAVNLMGAVRLTRGVLPPMVAARALYIGRPQALADWMAHPVKRRPDYPEMPPQNYLPADVRLEIAKYILDNPDQ